MLLAPPSCDLRNKSSQKNANFAFFYLFSSLGKKILGNFRSKIFQEDTKKEEYLLVVNSFWNI